MVHDNICAQTVREHAKGMLAYPTWKLITLFKTFYSQGLARPVPLNLLVPPPDEEQACFDGVRLSIFPTYF